MKSLLLIILLATTFLLRLPSLSEPYWYGDEGVTLTVSQVINRGGILYKDIEDNKPPLLYFLGAAVHGDLILFKALTLIWSLLTLFIFYLLAKLILGRKLAFLVSLVFTFLTNSPIFEGNIINGEIYFLLPTTLSAYLVWRADTRVRPYVLYLIGFISSLGFLIKVPALMDFLAIILFLIFLSPKIFSLKTLKQLTIIALGFLTPLLLTACYFLLNHAFFYFLNGAFLNNFTYSLAWQTKWLTPNQYLFLKVFVLFGIILLLFIKRKKLSPQIIFLTLWFSFSLFGTTLSSRPYPHYLLQTIPSLILLIFSLLKKKLYFYTLLPTTFTLLILFYQFNPNSGAYYQNSFAYYKNFLLYQTGKFSQEQYFQTFDPQVSLTYSLAGFLQKNTKPEEKVFVWSDNPLVYALSKRQPAGRLIAAYYINSMPTGPTETAAALKQVKPKFVIITLPQKEFKELDKIIQKDYKLAKQLNKATIYQKNEKLF